MWPFTKKEVKTKILTPRQIKEAFNLSSHNKKQIEESTIAGCYWCKEIFPAKEVVSFLASEEQDTANCPRCEIDSVLGDKSGLPISKEVLTELHDFWYSKKAWGLSMAEREGQKVQIAKRSGMTRKDRKNMPWILEISITPKFAIQSLSKEENWKMHQFIDDLDTELRMARLTECIAKVDGPVYKDAIFCLDSSDKVSEIEKLIGEKYAPEITWKSNLTNDPKWKIVSKYLKS